MSIKKPLLALTGLVLLVAFPALAQVNGSIIINNNRLQGTATTGQLMLFSPDPVQGGSSLSHWDPSATPNLLMEPSISADLPFLGLDVTPGQMQDIGWPQGTSNINIIALDPPGVGFTDPRPFGGAPGNPATTLGEARVNLFNAVLGAWGNALQSAVDIDVLVTWQPLFCSGGAAVLGMASTTFAFRNNPNFPLQDIWYHSALAESLAGEDLSGSPAEGGGDLIVFMNDSLDSECLAPGTGWYYGLDGNNPQNQVDQAPVVLHEIGHGLGFANFTNESTGALFEGSPNIYDVFTLDLTTGQTWDQMTDAERVRSAINVRRVVWNGPQANAGAVATLTPGVPELMVTSPAEAAGVYNIGLANFGPPIPGRGLTGQIACMKDDVADATLLNGCTPATNPGQLQGRIALIDRGSCSFVQKVQNAEAAGAIGAIIVNNSGNNPLTLGGSDPTGISAVSVGRSDGNRIRQAACGDAAAFLVGDRFQVTAQWATRDGRSGEARAEKLTDETGFFYFFDEDNVELVVKVLDACNLEGFNNFWVFAAGLTDVEVNLTVTDTQSGQVKSYSNPLGQPFQPIQDTEGFATCP